MTGRPRSPSGDGSGNGGTPPGRPGRDGRDPSTPAQRSVAQAQEAIAESAQAGRPGHVADPGNAGSIPAHVPSPEDVELTTIMNRYEQLGDDPPKFEVARNDDAHAGDGAHTLDRHGPDIPLPRDPTTKTIEGRIYGDTGWDRPENWSYRWSDSSIMNRTIRDYVRENWVSIRSDLAESETHLRRFDVGNRVGEGYYNPGMYGVGPRESVYATTSFVTIRIKLVPGSDPPEPFIVTAFPTGLL